MKHLFKLLGLAILILTLAFAPIDKKVIVIDVSHGGQDCGQQANGMNEKDIALEVALQIKQLAQESNITVILTRDSDTFLSLKDRVAFINAQHADYMISLHVNGNKDEFVSGHELYVGSQSQNKEASNKLANAVLKDLHNTIPSGGIKEADFYVLKHTDCPAILIEMGFLTNAKDQSYLTSTSGQAEIAKTIFESIRN